MSGSLETVFLKARSAQKRGDADEARRLLQGVLDKFPKNRKAIDAMARLEQAGRDPQTWLNDEVAAIQFLHAQGDYAEMARRTEALIAAFPQLPALHGALGAAYLGMEDGARAAMALRKAIAALPGDPAHHCNLGIALRQQGMMTQAEACYRHAIALSPAYAQAHHNLANLMVARGRRAEAAAAFESALAHQPDYADALYGLGNLHRESRDHAQAIARYEALLRLCPDHHDGWTGLACVRLEQGDKDAAVAAFARAASIEPGKGQAHINLANMLALTGALDEAHAAFGRAQALRPGDAHVAAQLLWLETHMGDWRRQGEFAALPIEPGDHDPIPPFIALPFEDDPARQLARSQVMAQHIMAGLPSTYTAPARQPGGRIRIGYVSADFHDHATMHLLSGLLREHDRTRFEVRAYSMGADDGSGRRQAMMGDVDAFIDMHGMSDEVALERMRADRLDIAVDLKGHTQDGRLSLFAQRVAPVQIGYLGYPGSVGADFLDYIVADPIVVPPGAEAGYVERIIRLPGSYQCNDNRRIIGTCPTDRTALGLPENGFIFCSFNQNWKIGPQEFDIWMRLLTQVEGSIFWLIRSNPWAQERLMQAARERGVDPARLVFAGKLPHADHLARHVHADLFLDSFIVNAHTTASDALWAGLPVLTMAGRPFAARVGASLLTAIGLPDMIAASPQDYEAKALDLALSPEKMAAVKARLAAQRLTTPLFDTAGHARHIEAAYAAAHARAMQGLRPDHIQVE
jgi:predicted O-linked N-acetylglucosamine transferase (SPINDLY family)